MTPLCPNTLYNEMSDDNFGSRSSTVAVFSRLWLWYNSYNMPAFKIRTKLMGVCLHRVEWLIALDSRRMLSAEGVPLAGS